MDYKFLDKVVEQIVSETEVDNDEGRVYTPFSSSLGFLFLTTSPLFLHSSTPPLSSFSRHCKNIYGLNEDEIDYVWVKYKKIIKDKIK